MNVDKLTYQKNVIEFCCKIHCRANEFKKSEQNKNRGVQNFSLPKAFKNMSSKISETCEVICNGIVRSIEGRTSKVRFSFQKETSENHF